MLLLALIPIFMGSGLAIQTAINSRLGSVSVYLALPFLLQWFHL